MLKVIELATSAYIFPIVLAQKNDGTHRFCVDYGRLNGINQSYVEILPNPELIFAKVATAKFSKFDMAKGTGR